MRWLILFAASLLVLASVAMGGAVAFDVWKDQQASIQILENITAYSEWTERSRGEAQFEIEKGEKVMVRRVLYGKDFMAVKVEKENGKKGWVYSSQGIRLSWPHET